MLIELWSMVAESEWKSCEDFKYLEVACCTSCHEEQETTGRTMCELYRNTDGVSANVCCKIASAIDKIPWAERANGG
jgi:hypothetical protein